MTNCNTCDTASRTVARKLGVLVSSAEVQGRDMRVPTIMAGLSASGIGLTRDEWDGLLSGCQPLPDADVLTALARYFGVHPEYLVTDGELSERVEAQLALLVSLRRNRVRSIAVRQMSDVRTATLQRIRGLLDEAAV